MEFEYITMSRIKPNPALFPSRWIRFVLSQGHGKLKKIDRKNYKVIVFLFLLQMILVVAQFWSQESLFLYQNTRLSSFSMYTDATYVRNMHITSNSPQLARTILYTRCVSCNVNSITRLNNHFHKILSMDSFKKKLNDGFAQINRKHFL